MSKQEEARIKIRNKELLAPASVVGALSALALLGGLWFGEMVVWGVLVVLVAGLFMVQFALLNRSRHESDQREHVYLQIEALLAVYASLPIASPLPPMRGWALSPDAARLVVSLVFEKRPRIILDVGSGVSTLLLAYGLKKIGAGRVMALEHAEAFAESSRKDISNHGLGDFATVLFAPLKNVSLKGEGYIWYDTAALEKMPSAIDMVIIDGPPEKTHALARYPALPLIWSRLAKDAVIVVDDAFTPATQKILGLWLAGLPGLTCSIVKTEKGTAILRSTSNAGTN
jgi:predicted O-methyltransferase YrrM